MLTLTPIPTARQRTHSVVNSGDFASERMAKRMSCKRVSIAGRESLRGLGFERLEASRKSQGFESAFRATFKPPKPLKLLKRCWLRRRSGFPALLVHHATVEQVDLAVGVRGVPRIVRHHA